MFTMSKTALKNREGEWYISAQKEHHRRVLFEDAMRGFYRKYDIPFDEAYVWD